MDNILLIRTQASAQHGHGHIVRCLALAEEASLRGIPSVFVGDKETQDSLRTYGIKAQSHYPGVPRWVIRDLRDGSNPEEVRAEVTAGSRVLLLDDHGVAQAEATLSVDVFGVQGNESAPQEGRLSGLNYAPLRREWRTSTGPKSAGRPPCILVALGAGFSPQFMTELVDAFGSVNSKVRIRMLGMPNAQTGAHKVSGQLDLDLLAPTRDMLPLIQSADLILGKLGMTQLEGFALGVGSICVEPTQAHLDLQLLMASRYPGWPTEELGLRHQVKPRQLVERAMAVSADKTKLSRWARMAKQLVDGRGAERLISALLAE